MPGGAQRGEFPAAQRLVTFLYRGIQFSIIGFFASVVGHSATKFLVPYPNAPSPPLPPPPPPPPHFQTHDAQRTGVQSMFQHYLHPGAYTLLVKFQLAR